MTFDRLRLLIIISSLVLLASCYEHIYVLVLPEKIEGEQYTGKVSSRDWNGRKGIIKLFDNAGTPIICEAKYTMALSASTCNGHLFNLRLTCSNKRTIDFHLESRDCTESHGIAKDDLGNTYKVYFGIYDDILKIQQQHCPS